MIRSPARYLMLCLAGFATLVALRLVVAIAWDPFADFYYLTGIDAGPYRSVENHAERKIKRRMVDDAAPGALDAAYFGNSRAAAMDPADPALAGLFANGVNLSFAGADLVDVVPFIARVKSRHPGVRPLVGLDFDRCFGWAGSTPLYLDPAADRQAIAESVQRLLSLGALADGARALVVGSAVRQEILANGAVVRHAMADTPRRIAADTQTYGRQFRTVEFLTRCVDLARDIRQIAPEAVLFINPLSRPMMGAIAQAGRLPELAQWRHALAQLGGVVDFSCSATLADGDFLDGHHYGSEIARLMAADLGTVLRGQPPAHGCPLKPRL